MDVVTSTPATMSTRSARPAPPIATVTRWSVTSAAGRDPAGLAAAVAAGRPLAVPGDAAVLGPWDCAAVVADFDKVAELGRKGTRTLDRAAALAVATVGRIDVTGDDVGLVIGTGMGSLQSTVDFTRDALTGSRPYLVDPARFPNTVMNFAAGQCAIWHGLRGPNATVTAGRATGVGAVRYAARWLRLGHAPRVVVAAAEEMTPQRGWLEWTTSEQRVPLGEGCAALLLEAPGAAGPEGPLAEVLAVSTALAAVPERVVPALSRCVAEVAALLPEGTAPDLHAPFDAREHSPEREALAAVRPAGRTLDVTGVLGDTGAVTALLQLQAAIATLAGAGGHAIVTSLDAEGVVGALLLRIPQEDAR